MELRSEFSSETMKARKEWKNVFKALKEKKNTFYPAKISFKGKGKIKIILDKRQL